MTGTALEAGARRWAQRRPCGYDTSYGNLSVALTGNTQSSRALANLADALHADGIDGMLTKSDGRIDWNDANRTTLTGAYRQSRTRQREIEGLRLPHADELRLRPDQVRAVLDENQHLWRQYVTPRCEHLTHTEPR